MSGLLIPNETKSTRLHCCCIPLLVNTPGLIEEIQQRHAVDINVRKSSGESATVGEFRSFVHEVPSLWSIPRLLDYLTPKKRFVVEFVWKASDNQGQFVAVHPRVNWYLNNSYYLSSSRRETFQHDNRKYTVDFRSAPSTLTEMDTGVVRGLEKVAMPPSWSYSLGKNGGGGYVEHESQDSETLERFYRYGGDHVMLAGIKHTVKLSGDQMLQIDLESGERVPLKRFPLTSTSSSPPSTTVFPDHELTVRIHGMQGGRVDGAIRELRQKVQAELQDIQVSCALPSSFSPQQQENVLVYMVNMARQYCVKVTAHHLRNHTVCIVLNGEQGFAERVKVQLMSQSLELQQSILSMSAHVPSLQLPEYWEPQTDNCELKVVLKDSKEWNDVLKLVQKTIKNVKIMRIERIQNRVLWDKFVLERRHMSERNSGEINERLLFHGTRKTDPRMVVRSVKGIDFRCSTRDRRLLWGTGAYFAVNASYSDNYSYVYCGYKQVLVVKVLTGRSCSFGTGSNPSLTRPPPLNPLSTDRQELYDTVHGETGGSDVYVVYDHDKSYPAYLITYH